MIISSFKLPIPYKPSQFEQVGDIVHLLEVRLRQEVIKLLLEMPQLACFSVSGAFCDFSEVDVEKILGDVDQLMDFEGNVASGLVFDLAALA